MKKTVLQLSSPLNVALYTNVNLQVKRVRKYYLSVRKPNRVSKDAKTKITRVAAKPRHSACAESRGSGKMASLSDVKSKKP